MKQTAVTRTQTCGEAGYPPPCLPGFEHINRYWDRSHQGFTAKILPGEFYVSTHNELIATVLGSCVSACIRDKMFGIGGMNHFMLPVDSGLGWKSSGTLSASTRYGNHAMEQLINEILKNGGDRRNLEVKIIGGGRILASMTDIGQRNIQFVHEYLEAEGLGILREDVGDIYPRKLQYFPLSGKVRMKKLRSMHNNTIVERETRYLHKIEAEPVAGDVELF